MHSTHRIRLLLGLTALVSMPYLYGACGGQVSIGAAGDSGPGPGPGADAGSTVDTGTTPPPSVCPDGYTRDAAGN